MMFVSIVRVMLRSKSAVLLQQVVRLSVCNVEVLWSYSLD